MASPGIFLAQFAGDSAPFNSGSAITQWAFDDFAGAASDAAQLKRMLGL